MAKRTFYVVYLPVGWHERKLSNWDCGNGDYPNNSYWGGSAGKQATGSTWVKSLNDAHLFNSRAAARGQATKFNKWLKSRAERRGDTLIGRASVAEIEIERRVVDREG